MARQLVQRVACRLHPWLLGARAESTAVAPAAANAVESSTDAILQQLGPLSDPVQERKLREAIEMPVEVSPGFDEVSESERAVSGTVLVSAEKKVYKVDIKPAAGHAAAPACGGHPPPT